MRVRYVSFDPAMRGWMDDRPSYIQWAWGYARGLRRPGDRFGWQEYALAGSGGLMPATVLPKGTPLTWPLGVCGVTGLTAYFGLLGLGKPKAGETVVVSGAAGATGSVAAQIARIQGRRTVRIAGGTDECRWLTDTAKLDAAIDFGKQLLKVAEPAK